MFNRSYNLSEAFHIYIDRRISTSSKEFHQAAETLWEKSFPIASIVAHKFNNIPLEPEELISILMSRLYDNKRCQPPTEIKGVRSYVRTAFENIAIDIWRREIRHIAPEEANRSGKPSRRTRILSLDQTNDDGKTLHDFIATPEEEHNVWKPLLPLQDKLETYLYEKEIYLISSHSTPKGKRTFEQEAILFRKYRDNEYSPTGSPYKKFARQRTIMLEHLEEKRNKLLESVPQAFKFLQKLATEHKLQQLKIDIQEDADSTKKERVIQYHFDLLSFYQYTKEKPYDESDPMAYALFINAITSLFQEQLYRTQR